MLYVLVIDHDSAVFLALASSLTGLATVCEAHTEDAAMTALETLRFDAIVLDGSLARGTTTVELLKKLRQKLGDYTMIIAHSTDHGRLLWENGADAFVLRGVRAGMAIRQLLLSRLSL